MTGGGAPGASRPQLAVLGSPIAHSQSPALHSAAYRVLGFDADYGSVEVTSGGLRAFVDGLSGDWRGLSLTMPLKEEVLPLLATADRMATLTGAANTVLFEERAGNRRLQGFNTDVAGIVGALASVGVSRARKVLVLGAGATARSAIVAAAQLGAEHVTVAARNPGRASTAVAVGRSAGLAVTVIRMPEALGRVDADVTISTLPGGTLTADDVARVSPAPGAVLLDVAYAPWPSLLGTAWAAGAHKGSGVVVSGLLMLVHQALMQVRVFVNRDPAVELPGEPDVLAAMLDAVGLEA
ncbi:hypothetical protein B7R54_09340 [Subtercola boreus]|uniref:Shikimate dehydrogenase substrate binding N-terminal domain-containing protein n=1 Tax=Subtercola boreus TaxID=120213 RepID=A0A3E0VIU9_9MICO|nr:shikimate dehydrogenase [Subtercola boreus]RFA09413.1 hypothetical protein B7R54_09340 [Subtercola boreus]TQL53545.1 shikimate dehydrogenase [Subtercola boreus]